MGEQLDVGRDERRAKHRHRSVLTVGRIIVAGRDQFCLVRNVSTGTSWGYAPSPDSNGYDANVRAIRLKPSTTFSTGGAFQIRYRVRIR